MRLGVRLASREGRVFTHKVPNVTTSALNEMLGEMPAQRFIFLAAQIVGEIGEVGFEQRKQRTKRAGVAAMRSGRDKHEMPALIGGKRLEQRVAVVLRTAGFGGSGAAVSFIDDDELRARAREVIETPLRFDELGRNDDEGKKIENCASDACASLAFEPGGSAGQDQLGFNVKLRAQLQLPLLSEVRRTKYGEALDLTAVEQLAGDEAGFDRFADADIVGDEHAHRI